MQAIKLKQTLENLGLTVFTTTDVVKITQQSKNTVNKLLSNSTLFTRLKRGVYATTDIESIFELAAIYNDAYVGLSSALEYYGATTQRYRVLQMLSNKRKRNISSNNFEIEFTYTKDFFGFHKVKFKNKQFFISDKEKTLLDCRKYKHKVNKEDVEEFERISTQK